MGQAIGGILALAIGVAISPVPLTAIAEADISNGQEAGALAVFILVGSLTIIAPLTIYFALGARAKDVLDGVKMWMAAHNAAIMTVLLLVLGAKLIGDAIAGLSA